MMIYAINSFDLGDNAVGESEHISWKLSLAKDFYKVIG